MPANLDMFKTTTMLKAVEQMPRVYTFLSDTFAKDGGVIEDDHAVYDYRRGNEIGLAPFVVPRTGGVPVNRDKFEMKQVQFAELAPELPLTMDDISSRQFGEQLIGGKTPEQRSKEILAKDLKTLRIMVQNSRNWMVREVLLTGKLAIRRYTKNGREKEASLIADFDFRNTYIPDTLWNQSGAKIGYDMEKAFDLVYDGLGMVDILVMGAGVFEAMMANSDYCKTLDMDRVYMDEIRTHYAGQGVRYRGTNSDGVKMVSYNGHFTDFDRKSVPSIPAGWILAGSSATKPLRIDHGLITEFIGQDETARVKSYAAKEVPFRKGGSGSDSISTRLVSKPTVVPENIGAWCLMKVL